MITWDVDEIVVKPNFKCAVVVGSYFFNTSRSTKIPTFYLVRVDPNKTFNLKIFKIISIA